MLSLISLFSHASSLFIYYTVCQLALILFTLVIFAQVHGRSSSAGFPTFFKALRSRLTFSEYLVNMNNERHGYSGNFSILWRNSVHYDVIYYHLFFYLFFHVVIKRLIPFFSLCYLLPTGNTIAMHSIHPSTDKKNKKVTVMS